MINHQPDGGTAGIREVFALMSELRRDILDEVKASNGQVMAVVNTNHAEVMAEVSRLNLAVIALQQQSAVVKFLLALWRPKMVLAAFGSVLGWFGFHGAQDTFMKFTGRQ